MTETVSTVYENPVIPGFHPDPSVCRVEDKFYLVTSSFEYFPGLPIFESTDLVTWVQLGHCLTRTSQLDLRRAPASGGLFAPTIRWHDGRFFVTCTNVSAGGHFIVHADDPAGPWSEPVWVDQDGIDPSLTFLDGAAYFASTVEPDPSGGHRADPGFQRGIQQSLIDPLTGAVLEPSRFLWEGSGGRFPEAPHLFQRGDWYYLLLAEGGTEMGHMVTIARSSSPWGPWESCPRNPILSHRSLPSPFQAAGHADFVELADGSWWAVCLATRPVGNLHHLGRETFLVPVEWGSDGWPRVGRERRIPLSAERPRLQAMPPMRRPTRDDFDATTLAPEWNTLRVSAEEFSSLTERPGALVLRGRSQHVVCGTDDPLLAFVGKRQQHFNVAIEARMDAELPETGEAGLTVRMNEKHHYDLVVRHQSGSRVALIRRRIGSLVAESPPQPVPAGSMVLGVDADADQYRFSVRGESGYRVELGSGEVRYLSSEVAGGFTGVYIGMFAAGQGTSATFDWFDYSPLSCSRRL